MVIFRLKDRETPRARAAELGIRVVWKVDLDDISGTHLHPADVTGAISRSTGPIRPSRGVGRTRVDRRRPGSAADHPGGVTGLTVAAVDPPKMAARWADVLGLEVDQRDSRATDPPSRPGAALRAGRRR